MKARKIFALLLTLALALSLAISASAATDYTITIDKPDADRVYKAYQIFTGDISSEEMTHIAWGDGVTTDGQTALQTQYGVTSAQKLAGKLSNSDDAKAFAENLQSVSQLDSDYLAILLKVVGIGFLAEIAALVCTDAGNATMGKVLQMLSSCVIMWLSLPLLNGLLELVQDILGEI